MGKINIGSDFSGVGAFNQALKRLKINYNEVFACDWNKYSRQTFVLNYGEPKYFPMDFNFGIPNVPDFKWEVSDSQAYKQAGNSIVVNVLCEIIKKLKL